MNITLINPSQTGVYGKMSTPDYPPMGLAYIGAVLEKAGFSVKIIDIDADKISNNELIYLIRDSDLIGLTATTPTFNNAHNLCKIIKEKTHKKIVLGGIHATIVPKECISSPFIDFVIYGEGEITILELAQALKSGKDFSKIKGLCFKKKNKIVINPPRELIPDLDSIPFPARHLFNHNKYVYPDSLSNPVMPILTSRGCPHGCTYCCTKLIFSRKMRFRSAKNVVDEIEHLIEKYHVKEIHFWDDNFTFDKKRVFEIHDELKRRHIKLNFAFPNGLRVDQVDFDILKCLKDMGVYSVAFGVESGNQEILNNVKKGITIDQIKRAYFLAKKAGLETWSFFMIGLPGDTAKTIRKTIEFAIDLDPDIAKFHILKPFPGTEVFNELKAANHIIELDYSKYGIHTPPVHRLETLSDKDLLNWSKIAYRKFYLRPIKIVKQLLRIKSLDRLFLNLSIGYNLLRSIV
jgi:radical SAM superfamily enzyme YgiQ (UPF0313 family)